MLNGKFSVRNVLLIVAAAGAVVLAYELVGYWLAMNYVPQGVVK